MMAHRLHAVAVICAACGDPTTPLVTAEPGIVFTFPIDRQLDVPLGASVVVTFSDPVETGALGPCSAQSGAFCVVGPDGPLAASPEVSADGKSVLLAAPGLEPGTTYDVFVRPELSPTARNVPASGPLFSFTTRTTRPRAAPPRLVAINGSDPLEVDKFRPLLESSTIRLVFSEPLDPRALELAPGAIELVEIGTNRDVPSTLVTNGIHVSIDPHEDLLPGASYLLRLGDRLVDLGGQPLEPTSMMLAPRDSRGTGTIPQLLRTRQSEDPGPDTSRTGADPNVIVIDKPLIGRETSRLLPSTLAAELGDPKALDGPIAFTVRKGQRLRAAGLDVAFAGEIATGLSTGDLVIELLTDGGGRLYRNPYQPPEQRPDNARAPLFVDLSLDVAIYAIDANGSAALTQTVLGVQGVGTAVATDGVLAIEVVLSMELDLLGLTRASSNLVLELIIDADAAVTADLTPPALVVSSPAGNSDIHPIDAGIELIFDEPIDLDRARAGGIRLEDAAGVVAAVIESHGAAVVVRPLAPLAYARPYRIVLADVADIAGNALGATEVGFTTPSLLDTNVPPSPVAVYPGVPCALTAGTATSPGRCAGGLASDDLYRPFALPVNEMLEVVFDQPMRRSSLVLGTACNSGSARIETLDATGACISPVAGTFAVHDRTVSFTPDRPWVEGGRYRLTLVAGGNASCDANEVCGRVGAANFDPLGGVDGGAGGPLAVLDFVGAAATTATFVPLTTIPYSDINGSGTREAGEPARDENRGALRITGTTGSVTQASFNDPDCLPATPAKEACTYLVTTIPLAVGEITNACGGVAARCMPVQLSPQVIYGTSVSMSATALSLDITANTGMVVIRVREPRSGPVMGYIVDKDGVSSIVLPLDLYMDAPDMDILGGLASHDLHSKPLQVMLKGPLRFLDDGRVEISLSNEDDVPVVVAINAPLGISGTVQMVIPRDELKLRMVSPPVRGVRR